MATPHLHTNHIETEICGMEENERVDCGHYEYLSQATPTSGGGLLCRDCSAQRWLLEHAPRHAREERLKTGWRESLERLIVALR